MAEKRDEEQRSEDVDNTEAKKQPEDKPAGSHPYGGFIDHVSDSFWFSAGPGEGMF